MGAEAGFRFMAGLAPGRADEQAAKSEMATSPRLNLAFDIKNYVDFFGFGMQFDRE